MMMRWLRSWREPTPADPGWERIAGLRIANSEGPVQVSIGANRVFHRIKLRSQRANIVVHRWILEFQDGTILDLSVNCLVDGSESNPMRIAGRRLKRVVVRFDARRVSRGGRLEIWAQP